MRRLDKQVLVYVDAELRSWLDEKAGMGYTMGGLARHMLRKQMELEKSRKTQ